MEVFLIVYFGMVSAWETFHMYACGIALMFIVVNIVHAT